jgi:pimeloyl-ACP methyl ester carboxylesterase
MPVLAVDGADIYYEVHGNGPPMLMLSGTACDGAFWTPHQVPEFSRDHTVIIVDQRGMGKTVTRGDDYATTRLAADAAAVVKNVGLGPAIVVGHSMGGRVAQLVALDHPETVKALILASTGPGFNSKGGIPPGICLGIIKQGYETYIREHNIDIGFSKAFVKEHPDRVEQCISYLLRVLPSIDVYIGHVNARQWHDTTARLKDIRVPCLVTVGDDEVHGLSDTTHVASAELLAKSIPGATFKVVRGGGHFYFFSHPEEIHRLMREFIGSLAKEKALALQSAK